MLINSHVHMSRFGVDFAPELGEYFANMFKGAECWYTGEPWKADGGHSRRQSAPLLFD